MTPPPPAVSTPWSPATHTTQRLGWLIGIHAWVWAALQALVQGNLDGYHDMLENFAWAQTFEWGTFKHPPFFAWVVGAWFAVFPAADWAYRLLAYANVAVGLWGVAALAQRLRLPHLAPAGVLLLLWALPYTTLAAKFNANSQLLSLWPWTAVALLACLESTGRARWAWHLALGLLAAASFLSKYYSGVFLLGFLVVAATRPDGRRWLLSPWPWLALAVFVAALLPHLAWLQQHDFATLTYAMNQGGGGTEWRPLLKFALTPLIYWGLAWLACVSVWAARASGAQGPLWRRWVRGLVLSWRPSGWADTLFWLAVLPGGITLLFGLAGVAEMSTPWAIPIGYAFSLLWLRNLEQAFGPVASQQAQQGLRRAAWPVLGVFVAVGLLHGWQRAQAGHTDHYRPAAQAAQDILALWAREAPGQRLGWVGGAWAENALLAFYGDPHIRALPGLPDQAPATLAPHPNWAQEGGVLLCPLGQADTSRAPDPANADPGADTCVSHMRGWLAAQTGQRTEPWVLRVARQGWRFPRSVAFDYAVFLYRPATPAQGAAAATLTPAGR